MKCMLKNLSIIDYAYYIKVIFSFLHVSLCVIISTRMISYNLCYHSIQVQKYLLYIQIYY